jgi:transporter family protein
MIGYALFNGIGSLCYKKGLNIIDSESIDLLSFSRNNVKGFFQLLRTPIWVLGLIFLITDFFIYQLALSIFEISVVKPLVNLNLIFVLFFGVVVMKEKVKIREWIGILFIVLGAVSISIFVEETVTVLNYTNFWIFLAVIMILAVVNIAFLKIWGKKNSEFFVSISGGLMYGLGSVINKGLYAINLVGFFFIFLVLFGISYGMAFFYSQAAYLKGRMSIVSTIVNIFSIIIPFIGGIFIFGDPLILSTQNPFLNYLKIIGLVSIVIGVFMNYKRN